MDYQYIYESQIKNLDYWSLVNMLLTQITPQMRKCILDKLTEMNNQLMNSPNIIPNIKVDLPNQHIVNSINNDSSPYIPNDRKMFIDKKIDVNKYTDYKNNSDKEIDLDEIIDDIHNNSDDLDKELARIKNLKDKILADKRKKRMDQRFKK